MLLVGAIVAVIVVGAAALTAQAARTHVCTAVGCTNAVVFDVASLGTDASRAATSMTLCANGTCTTDPLMPGQTSARIDLRARLVSSASVTLTDAAGQEVAHVELDGAHEADEWMPNGPDCEPTCWRLILADVAGALVPESVDQQGHRTTR
jgi:hypothetical protein